MQLTQCKLGYGGTKEEMERLLEDAEAISGIDYDISSYADVVEAIHVIQESMGITGTTAEEAEGTIAGSMSSLAGSVTNLLTGLGDEDADFETLFNNVVDSLTTLLENLLPVVSNFIVTSLPGIIQNIIDALPGVLDLLLENLPEMLTSLVSIAGQLAKLFVAMLPQILASIFDALPDILETLLEDLPDVIEDLLEAVGTIIGELVARLPELLPIIIKGIIRLIPALISGLWKAIKGMAGGIWDAVNSIFDLFFGGDSHATEYADSLSLMSDEQLAEEQKRVEKEKKLYESFQADLMKTRDKAMDGDYVEIDADEWIKGTGLTEAEIAEILGITPNEVANYIDAYFNDWGGTKGGVAQLFQYTDQDAAAVQAEIDTRAMPTITVEGEADQTSIDGAVTDGVEAANELAAETPVEVPVEPDYSELTEKAFQTFVTDDGVEVEIAATADETASYAAGQDAITGLINGMESKRSAAVATGSSIAADVIAAIKSAFEINSPSKKMMELGEFAGEGLDIGLQQSVGAAVDNMRGLVTGINMVPKMDLSSIQGQLAMINQTQAEQGSVILQLNGRELGRAAAPDMNTAVNGYTRRIAMGYGRG